MRKHKSVLIKDMSNFKEKLLLWSQQFDDVVWLDSNNYQNLNTEYDAVLAVDAMTSIQSDYHDAFDKLHEYQTKTTDWIFGYLSYDLKNDTEQLTSNNFDELAFPELYFFQPKKIFLIKGNRLNVLYLNMIANEFDDDLQSINAEKLHDEHIRNDVKIHLRIHKDEYFNKVNELLSHIHRGDIYEANFCQEFYADSTQINPVETYKKLNSISRPPFATFLKVYDKFLLSASPERYIKKKHDYIVSQPIKGTSKRSENPEEDTKLIENLSNDEKERSENIMIVDLLRNDLSQVCDPQSVTAPNICQLESFATVHHLVSKVEGQLLPAYDPIDLLQACFPGGSISGAPKIQAMKTIASLEPHQRGPYCGSLFCLGFDGYLDSNILIRTLCLDKDSISYHAGGAITLDSDPDDEYQESMDKAKALTQAIGAKA